VPFHLEHATALVGQVKGHIISHDMVQLFLRFSETVEIVDVEEAKR